MGSGGKGGGGSGGISVAPSPYEQALANMSQEYYNTTKPVRGYFLEDWANFLRPPNSTTGGITGNLMPSGYTQVGNWENQPLYASGEGGLFTRTGSSTTAGPTGPEMITVHNPIGGVGDYSWPNPDPNASIPPAQTTSDIWQGFTGDPSKISYLSGYGYSPAGTAERYDPSEIPGYKPLYSMARTGVEDQYKVAREQILASMPAGGARDQALTDLETGRLTGIGGLQTQISGNLIQDIMNKAYGATFNAPQVSMSGMGGAASSYATTQNAAIQTEAAQQLAASQGKGSGMGMLGLGFGSILGQNKAVQGIGSK